MKPAEVVRGEWAEWAERQAKAVRPRRATRPLRLRQWPRRHQVVRAEWAGQVALAEWAEWVEAVP